MEGVTQRFSSRNTIQPLSDCFYSVARCKEINQLVYNTTSKGLQRTHPSTIEAIVCGLCAEIASVVAGSCVLMQSVFHQILSYSLPPAKSILSLVLYIVSPVQINDFFQAQMHGGLCSLSAGGEDRLAPAVNQLGESIF